MAAGFPVIREVPTGIPLEAREAWPRCGYATDRPVGRCGTGSVCRFRQGAYAPWEYRCEDHDPTRQPWWVSSSLAGFEYQTVAEWPLSPPPLAEAIADLAAELGVELPPGPAGAGARGIAVLAAAVRARHD